MPDIFDIADRFRRELLAHERASASRMVHAYGEAWQRIKTQLDELTAQIAAAKERGEEISLSWLFQQERLQSLQQQAEGEIRRFARFAEAEIIREQSEAVRAAESHAEQLVFAGLGKPSAGVTVTFSRLPTGAVQGLVGFLQDGSPLRDLLDELGPAASKAIRDALVTGLATGQGPREIARQIRQALGGNLVRALTISRTEVLRAYRESTKRSYEANADVVKGWIWHSGLGTRTCAACWAMHGTIHKLDERLDDHVRGRCVMIPITRSWEELGFEGIPDTRVQIEPGVELFKRLPEEQQLAILGPAKFAAYRGGALTLEQLVGQKHDSRWGSMRFERSLSDILGLEQAARWRQELRAPRRGGSGGSGGGRSGGRSGSAPDPYPQLAPELRQLTGDDLLLWGDATERHRALKAILDAWERQNPQLQALAERVDHAVVAGLDALRLPRGLIRAIEIRDVRGDYFGAKAPDCTLTIAGDGLRDMIRQLRRPDTTFRIWVHESLHARRPFAQNWWDEYDQHNGYEEGLVETLARIIVREKAGMNPLEVSYEGFVRAYRGLADALGVDADVLLRELWQHENGTVRAHIVDVVDGLHQRAGQPPLTSQQRATLQGVADQLFHRSQQRAAPDLSVLSNRWKSVLR